MVIELGPVTEVTILKNGARLSTLIRESISKNKGEVKMGSLNSLATRYFFFPLTFVPIRNNFLTVPVGRLFI
jgi:hypothetical protein